MYFLSNEIPEGKSLFKERCPKILFIKIYDALIPKANIDRSIITTGIKDIQTAAGMLKAQIQIAPPTACAVIVAPRALKTKNLSLNGQTKKGISQNKL